MKKFHPEKRPVGTWLNEWETIDINVVNHKKIALKGWWRDFEEKKNGRKEQKRNEKLEEKGVKWYNVSGGGTWWFNVFYLSHLLAVPFCTFCVLLVCMCALVSYSYVYECLCVRPSSQKKVHGAFFFSTQPPADRYLKKWQDYNQLLFFFHQVFFTINLPRPIC